MGRGQSAEQRGELRSSGTSGIAYAPEAEHNPLAVWIAETLAARLRRDPRRRRDFAMLRAAVVLVAPDRRLSVTLRFDHGFLTVHDGMVGIPDVTFCGDHAVLTELAEIPLGEWLRLPLPRLGGGNNAWRRAASSFLSGELKIYGLLASPRTVVRLLRLLAAEP